MISRIRFAGIGLAGLLALAACGGARTNDGGITNALPQTETLMPAVNLGSRIKHIVVIVQENRTLDHMFMGFPGADTQNYGYWHKQKVPLHPVTFIAPNANMTDMIHNWDSAHLDWDHGAMDAFGDNSFSAGGTVGTWPYAYLERSVVKPYWDMASQYVLADHMFPTMFGASFTAHVDLIASTADLAPKISETDWPDSQHWGCDAQSGTTTDIVTPTEVLQAGMGPFPCFTQFATMADTLDAAKVSWKYYAPGVNSGDGGGYVWSEFSAIKNVRYGPDWVKVSSPPTNVLADASSGNLPQMSWVIPDWAYSDHSAANSDEGPSWVAAVVNAIGHGKDWDSTAIVVVWDDWGGWYDHENPPKRDWKGNGIRVPCLVISPYAKKGYVDHNQYEFASILKFAEQTFKLQRLGDPSFGYTDTRASALTDAFDFTQKPRTFVTIHAKYPSSHFMMKAPSMRAPDND
jgi:phospholipase C